MKIGILSDTHSLLRPEAVEALRGVDHILHAGDVGDAGILDRLAELAPVTAIRGNIDRTGPCSLLPAAEFVVLGGVAFYLLHNLQDLDLDPGAAGIGCVISGHTHKPAIEWKERNARRVLYFNPGSCGPRRFSLPVSLGMVAVSEDGTLAPELKTLSSENA